MFFKIKSPQGGESTPHRRGSDVNTGKCTCIRCKRVSSFAYLLHICSVLDILTKLQLIYKKDFSISTRSNFAYAVLVVSEVICYFEVYASNSVSSGCQVFMRFLLWLRSPSIQYDSVCISISLETVLWKAKISSSAVNRASRSAASWRKEPTPGLVADALKIQLKWKHILGQSIKVRKSAWFLNLQDQFMCKYVSVNMKFLITQWNFPKNAQLIK